MKQSDSSFYCLVAELIENFGTDTKILYLQSIHKKEQSFKNECVKTVSIYV